MCPPRRVCLRIIRYAPFAPLSTRSLRDMTREFDALYGQHGRPSIPPERLLRAQLLQLFYSIRSERLLMEQLDCNILFRWFVGLEMDERSGCIGSRTTRRRVSPIWGIC